MHHDQFTPTAALGAPPIEQQKENSNSKGKEVVQYELEDPLLQDDFVEDLDFDVGSMLNEIEQNVAISQVDTITNRATNPAMPKPKKNRVLTYLFSIIAK